MQCSKCGAQNVADFKFCGKCGEPRVVDVSSPATEPTFAGGSNHDYPPLPPADPPTPRPAPVSFASPVGGPALPSAPISAPTTAMPPRMASVGNVSENETYIGHRLGFKTQVESQLSGEVSPRTLFEFWIRAVIASFITFFLSAILAILLIVGGEGYKTGIFILFAFPTIVFYGSFFIPFREPLSEWELMVDGKAGSADSAYAAIYATLSERRTPVRTTPRRFKTVGDSSVNNFLIVQDGANVAYVSVFAYGTGLYLGWGLWRKRSPFMMMMRFLKDLLGGLFGRQQDFAGTLGSQRVRAMREAVHSSVREAIDAVNTGADANFTGTFAQDIPIETVNLGSEAAAPMPPMATHR